MSVSTVYDSLKYDSALGNVVLGTDTFYMLLVTGYTPNAATHLKRSDITGEVTGTGYTAGGQALSSIVVTNDTANNRMTFASASPAWATSTISATGAIIYKHRGGASSADNLVCYLDFAGTVADTNGSYTVNCPAAGWLDLT
jgi:hypothetical protein